jgi:hypothetical protein
MVPEQLLGRKPDVQVATVRSTGFLPKRVGTLPDLILGRIEGRQGRLDRAFHGRGVDDGQGV